MLRMSTALRTTARKPAARKDLARHRRSAVGNDQVDVARRRNHAGGVERIVALMQYHLADPAQPAQLRWP